MPESVWCNLGQIRVVLLEWSSKSMELMDVALHQWQRVYMAQTTTDIANRMADPR